jgi:hypothetical protein
LQTFGDDFVVRAVWRENGRALIKECHQEAILAMTADEYCDKLTTAGESEEVAEVLAAWISKFREGDTPTT